MATEDRNEPTQDVKTSWSVILSMLSYVLLMGVIGVPIWWKTTEVYRVALPFDQISNLDHDLSLKPKVNVRLISAFEHGDHSFGLDLVKKFEDSKAFTYLMSTRTPYPKEAEAVREAKDLEALDQALSQIHSGTPPGTLSLFEIEDGRTDKLLGHDGIVVGNHRTVFFSRGLVKASNLAKVVREVVMGERALKEMIRSIEAPRHQGPKSAVLRRVPSARGYDLLFSLIVPEPETVLAKWRIGDAIDSVMTPYVKALGEAFPNITMKSQVLYLTKLNLKTKQDAQGSFIVDEKDLGLAINPIESQLASHVSNLPRLNFLAYIPTSGQSPLFIKDGKGDTVKSNSFLIPRWGGVTICNPKAPSVNSTEVELEMDQLMAVFLSQLRLLLGVQDVDLAALKAQDISVREMSSANSYIRAWERDFLYRLRTLENLALTRVTLQSLAHLLTQISNIVINDVIGDEVRKAVEAAHRANDQMDMALLDEAFVESQTAFLSSDTAFFDPSLLALLYFPEDQKYAIYIPLFLPAGIPVVMSLKQLFQYFTGKSKVKQD